MSLPANLVTIHPYFKAHAGTTFEQIEEVLREFVAATKTEPECLFYEFTVNDDVVFCREGYPGGEATLHHLQNVGSVIAKMLTISDMIRLEFHGPAAEIDKLREPLAHLNPAWFVLHSGIAR